MVNRPAPPRAPHRVALELEPLEALLVLSGSVPSVQEQVLLERLNDARANPAAYGRSIGLDLSGVAPAAPLAFNPNLITAARGHAQDMNARNYFGHATPEGARPGARINGAGVAYTSYADLSQKREILGLVEGVLRHVNTVLPPALRLRRFVDLHKEFDPDDGEVTRTRKLRRNVIEANYAAVIDALYAGAPSVEFEARITYETGETGALRRSLAIVEVGE